MPVEQCPALNLEGIKLQPWALCAGALAWGVLLLDYGAGRLEPVEGTKSKCHLRLRLGGRHRDAWGEHRALSSWQVQGAAERSENKERNRVKTEGSQEQSVRKVGNQLVEEGDVPQRDGVWSMCSSPERF